MRLNQVEPIRQATFGGRLALARHAVALPNNEAPFGRGVSPIPHHPLEEPKEISLGLDQYPSTRLGRAAVKGDRAFILDIVHCSLLSRDARSQQRATSALFETLSKS